MAGLLVLGAASAAAQLIDYGFGIVWYLRDLHMKVKYVSQRYRDFEDQLNLLIHLAENIKNSPALQTKSVKILLEATTIEIQGLQALLCRPSFVSTTVSPIGKLWAVMNHEEEKKIRQHLERLYKQNAGLSSYIAIHTAEKVTTIGLGMEELKGTLTASSELVRTGNVQSYNSDGRALAVTSPDPIASLPRRMPQEDCSATVVGGFTVSEQGQFMVGKTNTCNCSDLNTCSCSLGRIYADDVKITACDIVTVGVVGRDNGSRFQNFEIKSNPDGSCYVGTFSNQKAYDGWLGQAKEQRKETKKRRAGSKKKDKSEVSKAESNAEENKE